MKRVQVFRQTRRIGQVVVEDGVAIPFISDPDNEGDRNVLTAIMTEPARGMVDGRLEWFDATEDPDGWLAILEQHYRGPWVWCTEVEDMGGASSMEAMIVEAESDLPADDDEEDESEED